MHKPSVDIAVLGGGIAGYYAALEAAAQGKRVALIERRGFLGYELTATGHFWIQNGSSPHEVFQAVGARKKQMLHDLLDMGVQLILFSSVAGIMLRDKRACGVLVGNKFGLQSLCAKHIIDTTSNAAGFLQLGLKKPHSSKAVKVSYTFTMENLRTQYENSMSVPEELGLENNNLYLHSSLLPNTIAAEMRYMVPGPVTAAARGQLEQQARLKAFEVFGWLREHVSRYENAHLLDFASEILIYDTAQTEAYPGMAYFPFRCQDSISTTDLSACRREAARLTEELELFETDGGETLSIMLHGKESFGCTSLPAKGLPECLSKTQLHPLQEGHVPTMQAQAVVAGSGSAGTFAAMALLDHKIETVVIHPQQDAGGTRTLGRVSGNYFGFVEGMAAQINCQTEAVSSNIGGPGKAGDRIARILLYHNKLYHPSCTFLSGHTVCGVLMEGRKVTGVWIAGDDGLLEVRGKAFVDTTSDGDLAVFAGAGYSTGCPLDGSVMTNGQWGDSAWRLTRWTDAPFHTDFDVIHPDRYDELLRAVYLAHGNNSDLDFSPFPNLRETRRIEGEYTLTLTDVLLRKPFDDFVSMACTPYDTHGVASSVLLRMGMLEFNENPILVRMPLRCFIPKGVDGLLVGGKAASATRDASSLFRMNADVENAGYALGVVSAHSIKQGRGMGDISLPLVQAELKNLGNMPNDAFSAYIDEDAALKELYCGDPQGLLHTILQPGDAILSRVYDQFNSLPEGKIREKHAMVLAFFGHQEGIDVMLKALAQAVDIENASVLLTDKEFGREYIRWDGELGRYYRINRIITLLGVAADKRAIPLLLPYLKKAEAGGPVVKGEDTYHHSRLDKWCVPYFDRLLCLVFAVERLADHTFIPLLSELLHKPYISGYIRMESDNRESVSTSAWLELKIAGALARCGSKEGYLHLMSFTKDKRAVFSEHAKQLLQMLAGEGINTEKELDRICFPKQAQPETRIVIY